MTVVSPGTAMPEPASDATKIRVLQAQQTLERSRTTVRRLSLIAGMALSVRRTVLNIHDRADKVNGDKERLSQKPRIFALGDRGVIEDRPNSIEDE